MDKTGTLIHDFKTGNHLTDLQLCSRRRSLWEHQDGGRLRHRNYILRTFLSIFFNPHLRTCSCKNFFVDVELKPKTERLRRRRKTFAAKQRRRLSFQISFKSDSFHFFLFFSEFQSEWNFSRILFFFVSFSHRFFPNICISYHPPSSEAIFQEIDRERRDGNKNKNSMNCQTTKF